MGPSARRTPLRQGIAAAIPRLPMRRNADGRFSFTRPRRSRAASLARRIVAAAGAALLAGLARSVRGSASATAFLAHGRELRGLTTRLSARTCRPGGRPGAAARGPPLGGKGSEEVPRRRAPRKGKWPRRDLNSGQKLRKLSGYPDYPTRPLCVLSGVWSAGRARPGFPGDAGGTARLSTTRYLILAAFGAGVAGGPGGRGNILKKAGKGGRRVPGGPHGVCAS